jgi:hypothetical protein
LDGEAVAMDWFSIAGFVLLIGAYLFRPYRKDQAKFHAKTKEAMGNPKTDALVVLQFCLLALWAVSLLFWRWIGWHHPLPEWCLIDPESKFFRWLYPMYRQHIIEIGSSADVYAKAVLQFTTIGIVYTALWSSFSFCRVVLSRNIQPHALAWKDVLFILICGIALIASSRSAFTITDYRKLWSFVWVAATSLPFWIACLSNLFAFAFRKLKAERFE